jgi:hypothetical protein
VTKASTPAVSPPSAGGHDRKYLVLTAMIFAVAMMFVDQTIVAIAVPYIQRGTIGAAGFVLWGNHLHDPFSDQWYWIVLAGAGIGLALTPVSTDSVNRAPRGSYGHPFADPRRRPEGDRVARGLADQCRRERRAKSRQ